MLQRILAFFLCFGLCSTVYGQKSLGSSQDSLVTYQLKTYPKRLEAPIIEALSHFPELDDVAIDFQLIKFINGAVMQAQPKIFSLMLDGKNERKYRIKITERLIFDDLIVPIEDLPHDALVGWLGHELGHVMDYIKRSSFNMITFGLGYTLSKKKYIEAELVADSYAIAYGLGPQILFHKNYILDHDKFPDSYKDKIRELYMSPSMILSLIDALKE
jgi:hypothetical protein